MNFLPNKDKKPNIECILINIVTTVEDVSTRDRFFEHLNKLRPILIITDQIRQATRITLHSKKLLYSYET